MLFRKEIDNISQLLLDFHSSEYDNVMINAQGLISRAYQNKDSPDLGIILHIAHTYLGLVSLINDDVVNLRKELLNSLQIPKSNGIYGFGPNMLLCRYLLGKYSDFDTVDTYLKMSRSLSSLLVRILYIRKWQKSLNRKEIPDFRQNLYYHIFLGGNRLDLARSIINRLDTEFLS